MIVFIKQFWAEYNNLIAILTIPFISGFIGWFTNMVAIKMTFFPLHYKGIPGFWKIPPVLGWQGIIPRKAYKMASVAVDIITQKLITVEEIYSRLDPKKMSQELDPVMMEMTEDIINDVGQKANPSLWKMMPNIIKQRISNQVKKESPDLINLLLEELKANVYVILNVKAIVLKNLTGRNVKKTVEMFQRCGGPEFRFIEMSGLYLGFLMGLFQMGIYIFFDEGWTLPVAGVVVGYVTNWLALKMIFRPQKKKRYGFFSYQGLFHKRQNEVSKEYANLVATEILSPRQITNHVLFGSAAETFFKIITKNISMAIDGLAEYAKPAFKLVIGEERYTEIKLSIIDKISETVPRSARKLEVYIDKALDLENTLYNRLKNLPPPEFERILRTAFQEDELLLILVGAALGALAGFAQWMLLFV